MPLIYDDPEYWRKRAAEARQMAAEMADPMGQKVMLEIAAKYELLADRTVERLTRLV